jgi:3-oxoacid CoA-transferase subunit A
VKLALIVGVGFLNKGANMDKTCANAEAALNGILKDDMMIMAGGFGLCGIPEHAIAYVAASGIKGLTVVSNNCGVDGFGLGIWLHNKQIRKMIASYVGENKEFERQFLNGELQIEFNPQGTLAERIRAGGAGIAGFYTKTGVGTMVAEGKEVRTFNGKKYMLETSLFADLAIIKAWKGDRYGNLIYRKTARNFNAPMATAAKFVVAEVEHLVEPHELEADSIHTAGIYVDKIFVGEHFEKRIEFRTTRAA